ncbi:MAG: hypothetical protein ACOYBU_11880, partial [Dermatophilaceae bacterium]
APTEEAAGIYRDLATANPAFTPDLASALTNLANRYSEVGLDPQQPWSQTLAGLPGPVQGVLLIYRAGHADTAASGAASWLAAALGQQLGPAHVRAAHDQARRHRQPDPSAFDTRWRTATGQEPPGWLAADPGLLVTAEHWIQTDTYEAERDHLGEHPELLDPHADAAVEEALLAVGDEEADRYRMVRLAARADGLDTAYRPILLTTLAHRFAAADLDTKRALLDGRRTELVSDQVAEALAMLDPGDDPLKAIAAPLVDLARMGVEAPVLDALETPERFAALLHAAAAAPDPQALAATAHCAVIAASTTNQAALGLFYRGVAHAVDDPSPTDAVELVRQARALDESQTPTLLALLVQVAAVHPATQALLPALTEPLPPARDEEAP